MLPARQSPQDRARYWVYVATFLLMLGQGVVIPLLPSIVAATRTPLGSAVGVGVAVAAFGVARLLTNIPAGYAADLAGRRALLVVGPMLTAGSMIGVASANSLELVVAWRVVAGVGSAIYLTGTLTYLGDIAPSGRQGSTFAYFYTAFSAGIAAGPAIGGVLAELHSIGLPLVIVAITSIGSALIAALALPAGLGPRRPAISSSGPRWRPWSDRRFLVVGVVILIGYATRNGTQQTVVPVTALDGGVAVGLIGVGFSLSAIMSAAGGPVLGRLLDRVPRRRVLALVTALTGVVLFGWTLTAWLPGSFLVTMALFGFTSTMIDGASVTTANDIPPEEARARSVGFYRLFGDAGYVVGPLILGALADGYSSTVAIAVNAIALVGASALALIGLGAGKRRDGIPSH